ncbi:hypothetical protein GQ42DRAFT_114552, partial [Ramicandelaber brevisporus]
MRGPNFYFPVHNRASVSITPSLYDRRALDCTAVMPLLNSLSHLGVLTITAPRIREVLTTDGGLERLLEIMRSLPIAQKIQAALYEWLWTAAYQCLVHVGVRGTEVIRTRMIKIGVVDFLVSVLKSHIILGQIQHTDRMLGEYMNAVDGVLQYETIKQLQMHHQQQQLQLHQQMQTNLNLIDTNVFARSEDVLHGLNLLGYLTKYLSTREMLNQIKGPDNIFAIVEQFTQPSRGEAMNEKALIVMHNLVRHDNDSVPRRCVNFKCLKQEDKEQGFTLMRCKRCRKARYCSRNCQTDAWRDGHRFWCKERKSSSSS